MDMEIICFNFLLEGCFAHEYACRCNWQFRRFIFQWKNNVFWMNWILFSDICLVIPSSHPFENQCSGTSRLWSAHSIWTKVCYLYKMYYKQCMYMMRIFTCYTDICFAPLLQESYLRNVLSRTHCQIYSWMIEWGRLCLACTYIHGTKFLCFCRGTYELQPKAFHGKAEPILGPKIQVQLQPNLMKPTSLSVEYDKKAVFTVGEKLPGM